MKGFLQVEILAACCAHWEIGEDDFDDHIEEKMGGEPCPTGRANLFDTRKILMCTPDEGKRRSIDFSHAPGKRKCGRASVPLYTKKTKRREHYFINLKDNKYNSR